MKAYLSQLWSRIKQAWRDQDAKSQEEEDLWWWSNR